MVAAATPDILLSVRDEGRYANVLVDTERARTLSPEADAFFARLAPFVTLVQDDAGGFGFVDVEEVVDAGEEPALLGHPFETTRFLQWFGRKWNAQRPLRVLSVVVEDDQGPRNRRLRVAPTKYTRRGRRDA